MQRLRGLTMNRVGIGVGMALGVAALVGVVVVAMNLLRGEPQAEIPLTRPVSGEVRADHLPDGTPVWVIGHRDGTVAVLSGFDPHTPYNLGKLNWWCPTAAALENPSHGSKWDEYGVKLGGPAPTGLASWHVRIDGSRVFIGESIPGPSVETLPAGPPEVDRDWCTSPEDDVIYHTFDGWRVWDSPTAAVREPTDDWILLEGELVAAPEERRVRLCALGNCADSVIAANVEMPVADVQFGPLEGGRFIAHVRNGSLVDVTRVVFLEGDRP